MRDSCWGHGGVKQLPWSCIFHGSQMLKILVGDGSCYENGLWKCPADVGIASDPPAKHQHFGLYLEATLHIKQKDSNAKSPSAQPGAGTARGCCRLTWRREWEGFLSALGSSQADRSQRWKCSLSLHFFPSSSLSLLPSAPCLLLL